MGSIRGASTNRERKGERGVTMALVAVALVVLLAMAALAIDVVTLYVASNEAQRAADASALAGAKAFVISGFTSGQMGSPTDASVQTRVCQTAGPGATALGNQLAQTVATQNTIAGVPATIQNVTCSFSASLSDSVPNPQITVRVQSQNLPTFFARIWGRRGTVVSATATAEAFNPSGTTVPINVAFMKPWLLPNCNPNTAPPCAGATLVDPTTYLLNNPSTYIGQSFRFTQASPGAGGPAARQYYVMELPPPQAPPNASICPFVGQINCNEILSGSDPYQDTIACSTTTLFSCGMAVPSPPVLIYPYGPTSPNGLGTFAASTQQGIECLIHAGNAGTGQGQDEFGIDGLGSPITINGGNNNPDSALQNVTNISRSDSIVTVPIYDVTTHSPNLCPSPSGPCTGSSVIVGFVQLAIQDVGVPTGDAFDAIILNVAGCNPAAAGTPVIGGAVSPVPTRLIHN